MQCSAVWGLGGGRAVCTICGAGQDRTVAVTDVTTEPTRHLPQHLSRSIAKVIDKSVGEFWWPAQHLIEKYKHMT